MSDFLTKTKKPKYLTEELLSTIDMIACARDSELAFDKTIIAEIVNLNNAETGEYYVRYQQGTFKAYAPTALKSVYAEGTNVYVKIPGGDFSAKKFIEGKASLTTATELEYDFMSSNIIEMAEIYPLNSNTYQIRAGAKPNEQYYEQVIYETENNQDLKFISLFKTYPSIKIAGEFKTSFLNNYKSGNYGLKVEFYGEEENSVYTRKLEIANFVGNLYEYLDFSPQAAIYSLKDLSLTNLKKITFFQELYSNTEENNNQPNLEVKNIKISFIDNIDNTDSLYYIGISAPNGLSVLNDNDIIKLEGKFYYALKDIMNSSNCVCQWFKQNPEIIPGHELYNQYAGGGWELITDGTLAQFNQLTVRGSDVYQSLGIKLVVIYNATMIFSHKVKLIKYYNSRFAVVKKETENGTVLELLDSTKTIEGCDWYVHSAEGYKKYATNVKQININEFLNYGEVLFEIAIPLDENHIIPFEYTLKNYLLNDSVNVIFEGPDTFLYDKDGTITSEGLNFEFSLKPIIATKSSVAITELTWIGPDGQKIYELARQPTESMIKSIRVDNNNIIYFTIQNRYQKNRTFNTLQLKVQTSTGENLSFYKTLSFIKEGQKDMSGLTYNLVVNYSNQLGNEQPIKPLLFKQSSWNKIYLHPMVYVNGSPIKNMDMVDDDSYYEVIYQVQDINTKSTMKSLKQNEKGDILDLIYIITGSENHPPEKDKMKNDGQYFVHFIVTINIKTTTGEIKFTKIIHHYQPILIGYGDLELSQFTNISIPNQVLYNSQGTSPSYSNEAIEVVYKNISQTDFAAPIALNKNLTIVPYSSTLNPQKKTEYHIYPTGVYTGAHFSPGEKTKFPMSAILINLHTPANGYIIQPVAMILEPSENSNITGQDGTLIAVPSEKEEESRTVLKTTLGLGHFSTVRQFANRDNSYYPVFSGMAFAENPSNNEIGLYGYAQNGEPSVSIKSDGSVSFGKGAFEILVNENGEVSFSANEAFKNFIKSLIIEEE